MKNQELAGQLRRAISMLHKNLRRAGDSEVDYSMTELETIGHLTRHDRVLPGELARHTHITPQSMSQILKRLEEQGIIKRIPAPEDGRKVYISITQQGRKMVDRYRHVRDEWLDTAIDSSLTAKEIELLTRAVPVLHKLISKS